MNIPPSLHILIVEDNDSLRDATKDFLNDHGHHAIGVASAEEVDDVALRDVPDLYLVDINLPGENGFSLTQRIRKSHPLAGIVLMTARGQLHDRLDGYERGADHYLTKPVEPAELLACIHSLAFRLKSAKQPTAASLVLDAQTMRLSGPAGQASLTHGECLLLSAFCRAAGQKLERWQVMGLVDSKDKGLTPASLEMRISALRKKLGLCGATENPILTLRGFGYALNCQVQVQQYPPGDSLHAYHVCTGRIAWRKAVTALFSSAAKACADTDKARLLQAAMAHWLQHASVQITEFYLHVEPDRQHAQRSG